MILAVDAGNSRVKWALHDVREFVREGTVMNADIEELDAQWSTLPAPSSVIVANVAGDGTGRTLEKFAQRWRIALRWAASTRAQAGVTNGYDDPAQLGVDRWAALIGARRISTGACVVVNAGTATTVDAISAQGEFIGGIIVPGIDLMHDSLAANTARLSATRGKFISFPRTTQDAITSGAIQASCGAVERMRNAMLESGHQEPVLIFSGGAAELVARHVGRPVRVVDKLVLDGLVQMAREPQ